MDIDILVADVDSVMLWDIAKKVHLPAFDKLAYFEWRSNRVDIRIEMRDRVCHSTNEVVELVGGRSVDEAVIYPFASSDSLVDFGNQLERIFYAFIA
jgi:hypothetical protein